MLQKNIKKTRIFAFWPKLERSASWPSRGRKWNTGQVGKDHHPQDGNNNPHPKDGSILWQKLRVGSVLRRAPQDPTRRGLKPTCRFPSSPLACLVLKMDDSYKCYQTLDGRFGDGKSEAHGKYSAKEGVRPNQARPQTNIKVDLFLVILAQLWSFADPWREVWRWKKRSPRKI